MQYIFMNNFRGFNDTILPLQDINFLVGENSTGKSSFLKLLYLLSRPHFWFSVDAPFQDDAELGGFNDMVSAWSSDRSNFETGILATRPQKKKGKLSCSFAVHTFADRDGTPYVSRFLQYYEGRLTKLIFQKNQIKYKVIKYPDDFTSV
jgi:hypothetical protein